jgi:hypothetical protein
MQQIQSGLKAPKGQTNTFGNYKYRSCEDIVEALKPLLAEHDAHLSISDEMINVGDRVYVCATAKIIVDKETIGEACAYAREPLSKKGMDEAQITGATSSYARKYALNGLLAIDDTKDADTQDNSKHKQVVAIKPDQVIVIDDMLKEAKADKPAFLKHYKIQAVELMSADVYHKAVAALEKKIFDNKEGDK